MEKIFISVNNEKIELTGQEKIDFLNQKELDYQEHLKMLDKIEQKKKAKMALFEKLGLTEEEFNLLLG